MDWGQVLVLASVIIAMITWLETRFSKIDQHWREMFMYMDKRWLDSQNKK